MRCDFAHQSWKPDMAVSIHTPTWGVTAGHCRRFWYRPFQSTHLHEVWLALVWNLSSPIGFNPHTYMRCDVALVWNLSSPIGFNPHTYMRCDKRDGSIKPIFTVSIHTPTWGVTSNTAWSITSSQFQSTHLHEVWRQQSQWYKYRFPVSIHTPTWGVTDGYRFYGSYVNVSIHTPTWGVTNQKNYVSL